MEGFSVQSWGGLSQQRPSPAGWPAQHAGGAGVNISKGQQVWLCWDLEPAADVLPALDASCWRGAVEGGNRH